MLTLTKQSSYAFLFIFKLQKENEFISLNKLVEETSLPQRFLARIAAQLVKNKIVTSREGKVGGYKLAVKLNKISLYDFLKIFEKDVAFCRCSDEDYCCNYEKICHHKDFLTKKLNTVVIRELKKYTLADIYD